MKFLFLIFYESLYSVMIYFFFNFCYFYFVTDSVVGAGTITSPWTPVSAGPTGQLGPADTNGNDKHLDVGDMSDVSIFLFFKFNLITESSRELLIAHTNFNVNIYSKQQGSINFD